MPNFLRGYEIELPFVGSILSAGGILKLGPLYYLYLFALIIFCLNSINILAGVNGLEGMSKLSLQYFIWPIYNRLYSIVYTSIINRLYNDTVRLILYDDTEHDEMMTF